MPYSKNDINCEIITGGRSLQPPSASIWIHVLVLIYFIVWAIIYGIMLHWPTLMNAWVLAFVASGTGILILIATLGVASRFASSNTSSNLAVPGFHYTSGLVHVGLVMESSLIVFFAILVPSVLQLTYLAFNNSCCSWSGYESDENDSFIATYLISLFYYHFGTLQMLKLINAELKPVWQLTNIASFDARRGKTK